MRSKAFACLQKSFEYATKRIWRDGGWTISNNGSSGKTNRSDWRSWGWCSSQCKNGESGLFNASVGEHQLENQSFEILWTMQHERRLKVQSSRQRALTSCHYMGKGQTSLFVQWQWFSQTLERVKTTISKDKWWSAIIRSTIWRRKANRLLPTLSKMRYSNGVRTASQGIIKGAVLWLSELSAMSRDITSIKSWLTPA